MENISYFCIVKNLNDIIKVMILAVFLLTANKIGASAQNIDNITRYDSVEISLLTCSPHDEIYSLYGHTAIRYQDHSSGADYAINYGVFSFHKPYFVLRFVFGLTDYEMGVQYFDDFCREYIYYGASVTQQTLNLTDNEKKKITDALLKNYLPENRIYRYNFFYNNCTSKARDIIADNIDGKIVYRNKLDKSVSFRDFIHSCTKENRWSEFGNDILLGVNADRNTTRKDQQFLPENLMKDFSNAVIVDKAGKQRKLVKETKDVVDKVTCVNTASSIPSPTSCACILLGITVLVSALGWATKKRLIIFDAIMLCAVGLTGLLLFVMIFSQHPATSINLQILLLNPLALFMLYYIIRNRKDTRRLTKAWTAAIIFICASIICGFIQHYAEGVVILALSLLIRFSNNIIYVKKNEK